MDALHVHVHVRVCPHGIKRTRLMMTHAVLGVKDIPGTDPILTSI